jgi:hypothetical protein
LHFQDKTMPSKKAATKPGFTTLSASSGDGPRTKEEDPCIDEDEFNLEDNHLWGSGVPIDMLAAQEFRRRVKRDKTHYEILKGQQALQLM